MTPEQKITYTLFSTYCTPFTVIQDNMDEHTMRISANIFRFKKARVERLVSHPSKKYNYIWIKDYELHKIRTNVTK